MTDLPPIICAPMCNGAWDDDGGNSAANAIWNAHTNAVEEKRRREHNEIEKRFCDFVGYEYARLR